jgi:hypothetical protein
MPPHCSALLLASVLLAAGCAAAEPVIDFWSGETQRAGHLGDVQDDFNVLGRVEPWRDVDKLEWTLNQQPAVPLSFRAFRRLVDDGDFNADVPVARLRTGANTLTVTAWLRDGRKVARTIAIERAAGHTALPLTIDWQRVARPEDAGLIVDGRWKLTPAGLRTAQVGYDRIFLIGERTWRDYEVRTTFTVHALDERKVNDAGVGLVARFAGHVVGGPEHFPSGQPKWGYRPFGAIGWLRWRGTPPDPARPEHQYYPWAAARAVNLGAFAFEVGRTYAVRFSCRTEPDTPAGDGVTTYAFKLWPADAAEPDAWTWRQTQTSRDALRRGGVALLAHFADVTFGNLSVTPNP